MAELNVVTIIQARMSSSRLPGKVLKDLAGKPMLMWVVERARKARSVSRTVVATTTDPSDDAIEALCRAQGVDVVRGSQFDVLDRFYQAARQFQADVVVRVTADCPVMDPDLIDQVVAEFQRSGADFACNRLPPPWKRTFPIGLDIEVCSFAGLERAWREAELPFEREHVMPFFYDTEGRFKVVVVDHDPDCGAQRWTVDTPEDLDMVRGIFEALVNEAGKPDFTWLDVLALVRARPELEKINANVPAKQAMEVDARMTRKD